MARRRLGRGLDGLLPAAPPASERSAKNRAAIEDLHPGRMQPRGRMDSEALGSEGGELPSRPVSKTCPFSYMTSAMRQPLKQRSSRTYSVKT